MGGCRCVYRNCQSSTTQNTGLHYFHFPVRDPQRCEQWIINARKPSFKTLDRDRLRNKVVCSLHFEDKCFSNMKHDRLIHSAVPTLGNEDYEEENEVKENVAFMNSTKEEPNIMLIPMDEDNTKFALPDVAFSGMSYTIYDDAVIPTADVSLMRIRNEEKEQKDTSNLDFTKIASLPKLLKRPITKIKTIIKKVKTEPEIETVQENLDISHMKSEMHVENKVDDVISYSVSSNNGDVTVQPTINNDECETSTICDYINTSNDGITSHNSPLLDDNISLKQKGNNEFIISVHRDTENEVMVGDSNFETHDKSDALPNVKNKSVNTDSNYKCNLDKYIEKEYIKMIQNNSKDIKQLKMLVHKQNKLNSRILKQKHLTRKQPQLDKTRVIRYLKNHLKPSLLAILKLELLPEDEVVLSDCEEKFIADFYTEHSDCYNLLRNKWNWNLPATEKIDESENK